MVTVIACAPSGIDGGMASWRTVMAFCQAVLRGSGSVSGNFAVPFVCCSGGFTVRTRRVPIL
jgi:hypothetical protein